MSLPYVTPNQLKSTVENALSKGGSAPTTGIDELDSKIEQEIKDRKEDVEDVRASLGNLKTLTDTATSSHNPAEVALEATNGTGTNRVSVSKGLEGTGGWNVSLNDDGMAFTYEDWPYTIFGIGLSQDVPTITNGSVGNVVNGTMMIDTGPVKSLMSGIVNGNHVAGVEWITGAPPQLYVGDCLPIFASDLGKDNNIIRITVDENEGNAIVYDYYHTDETGSIEHKTCGIVFGKDESILLSGNSIVTNLRVLLKLNITQLTKTGDIHRISDTGRIGTYTFRGTPLYNESGNLASCPGTLTLTFPGQSSTPLEDELQLVGSDTLPGHLMGHCYDWEGDSGFIMVSQKPAGSDIFKLSAVPVVGRTYEFSVNLIVN